MQAEKSLADHVNYLKTLLDHYQRQQQEALTQRHRKAIEHALVSQTEASGDLSSSVCSLVFVSLPFSVSFSLPLALSPSLSLFLSISLSLFFSVSPPPPFSFCLYICLSFSVCVQVYFSLYLCLSLCSESHVLVAILRWFLD